MNTGDTGFILIATAFVFIMTPGLAFFYGGLGRRKNVLNTMMSSFFIMGVASVMWVLIGYTLSFSGDHAGIVGTFQNIAMIGMDQGVSPYAETIPNYAFACFQMMFAIITPALITGSVAGLLFSGPYLFTIRWRIWSGDTEDFLERFSDRSILQAEMSCISAPVSVV